MCSYNKKGIKRETLSKSAFLLVGRKSRLFLTAYDCQSGATSPGESRCPASKHFDSIIARKCLFLDNHVLQLVRSHTSSSLIMYVENPSNRDLYHIQRGQSMTPEPVNTCAFEPIWNHKSLRPNDQAIISWDGDLTYQELCQLSDHLASHLISTLHVGPETLVPVCFEKTKWAVVAILAILKAGGAFVPLSPHYPLNRLKEIIDDVGANIILVSEDSASLFDGLVKDRVIIPDLEQWPVIDTA